MMRNAALPQSAIGLSALILAIAYGMLTLIPLSDAYMDGKDVLPADWPSPDVLDTFERDWFASVYRSLGEPPLKPEASHWTLASQRVWRVQWIPSFDRDIVVRIDQFGSDDFRLHAVQGDCNCGRIGHSFSVYLPQRSVDRRLTPEEVATFQALSQASGAFDRASLRDDRLGFDGFRLNFEMAEPGRHHFITRWSPMEGPVHDLGVFMVSLSGFRLQPD